MYDQSNTAMATTILEGFEELRSNLEITDLQEETVSTRQTNVRKVLDAGLTVHDTFLTGSYKRSTMIAPLKGADVDIFAVVDTKYYEQGGQAALLDKVKGVLKKTYKTPDISRNGQAVTIVFDDFRVDVVPSFYRQGGGYLIPDSQRGQWISTDPKKHVEIWTAANKAHDGDLVPLMKVIKGWNTTRDLFRSFHLETIVLKVLDNVRITDYPSGARYVFDKAREKIKVKVADPAGYSEDVGAHVTTQAEMDELIKRLTWAYDTAVAAEALESKGDTEGAFEQWRAVFKDYFPAYG
jgi:hypothetical protein